MSLTARILFIGIAGCLAFILMIFTAVRGAVSTIVDDNVATYLGAYADILVPAIRPDERPMLDADDSLLAQVPRDWQLSIDGEPLQRSSMLSDWLPVRPGVEPQRFRVADSNRRSIEVLQRPYQFANDVVVTVTFGLDTAVVDAYKDDQRARIAAQLRPVLILAGIVVGALLLAQIIAVLRPMQRVRAELDALERGEAQTLDETGPRELAAVTRRINALVARNASVQARYRQFAANMAHAIKTPLTALRLRVSDTAVKADIDQINALVDRNLARARIAGNSAVAQRLDVNDMLDQLQRSYEKLFDVTITLETMPRLEMLADREDLLEATANILENACRHAKREVAIIAGAGMIQINDDGPGISPDERRSILARGTRLDEALPGNGIGLSISDEVVQSYQGKLTLAESFTGGLSVTMHLPGLTTT